MTKDGIVAFILVLIEASITVFATGMALVEGLAAALMFWGVANFFYAIVLCTGVAEGDSKPAKQPDDVRGGQP